MEEYDSVFNKLPTSLTSEAYIGEDGKVIALDVDSNAVSKEVRVYVNNKGHKVKVSKFKDEKPPDILRPETGLRPAPKIVTTKPVERLEVSSPDNKRLVRSKSNEVADENIKRVVHLKSTEVADKNTELKEICSDNLQAGAEKETVHEGKEAGDCQVECGVPKMDVKNDQDLKEKPKKCEKPKSSLTTPSKKPDQLLTSAKPEKTLTYDRDQMKAYIKAKRKQQAQKRTEEERLKQEALEMQRLKLEQLKEISQTIVKKCVRKVKEDEKSEWLGPLEDEAGATHKKHDLKLNDNIVQATRKTKHLTNTCSTHLRKSESKGTVIVKDQLNSDNLNKVNGEQKMDIDEACKNIEPLVIPDGLPNLSEKKSLDVANKLALRENTDHVLASNIRSVRSLKTLNDLERPRLLHSKSWHDFSGLHTQKCNIPTDFTHSLDKNIQSDILETPNKDGVMERTSPVRIQQEGSHTKLRVKSRHSLKNSVRSDQRQEIRKKKNDLKRENKEIYEGDLESVNESCFSEGPITTELTDAASNNPATTDLQPTPEWMKSFMNQPNPFRFINIVKLKLASQQRDQVIQLRKLEDDGRINHIEVAEETDAPSIESMEDDFKQQHVPLKLSDLKLNLPASLNSESLSWGPVLNNNSSSDREPRESTKPSEGDVKSLVSSIVSEAPLVVPSSIQSLTLKSKLDLTSKSSASVSLNSVSEEMSSVQGLVPPNDVLLDWKKSKHEFVSRPGRDSEPGVLDTTEDTRSKSKTESGKLPSPKVGEEGFEIGKVFTPSALHLQFQAELNKLDVFDHSIAQVMATERLRALMSRTPRLPHLVPKLTSSKVIFSPQAESLKRCQEKISASLDQSESAVSTSHPKKASDSDHNSIKSNKTAKLESTSHSKPSKRSKLEDIPHMKLNKPVTSEYTAHQSGTGKTVLSDHSEYNKTHISEHISYSQSNSTSISEHISESRPVSCGDIKDTEKEELKRLKTNKSTELESVIVSPSSTLIDSTLVRLHSISEAASEEPTLTEEEVKESSNTNNANNAPLNVENRKPSMNEYSFQVFEQLIKDEDLRSEHQKAVLKLRKKALTDRAKAEIAMIQIQKQKLREKGHSDLITNLKKKQRGILLKMKQDQDEIHRIMKRELTASEERKLALMQQLQIIKMHLSTKNMMRRFKSGDTASKKRTMIPSTSVTSANESSSLTDISTNFKEALDEQKRVLMDREKKIVLRRRMAEELIARQKRLEEEERRVREMEKLVVRRKPQSFAKKSEQTTDVQTTEQSKSPFPTQSSASEQIMSVIKTNASTSTVQEELSKVSEDLSKNSIQSVAIASSSGSRSIDYSEGFESPESSETQKQNSNSSHKPSSETKSAPSKKCAMVAIKVPLSPRLQSRSKQRYSSGSDDSIHLSQTETMSEQSDVEVRISVLKEQLRRRKLEAEKLRREQSRAQRERLKAKEQSLLKQIQAYDTYINEARKELDRESECLTPITRPQIKQPKVAEKVTFRRSESQPTLLFKEPRKKSAVSDEESVSIKSASEASSLETTIQSQEQGVQANNEEKNDIYLSEDIDEALSQTSGENKEVKTKGNNTNKSSKEEWFDAQSFFNAIKEDSVLNEIPTSFTYVTERSRGFQFELKLSTSSVSQEEQSKSSESQLISQKENKIDDLDQSEASTIKTISEAEISPEEQIYSNSSHSQISINTKQVNTTVQSKEVSVADCVSQSESETILENILHEENETTILNEINNRSTERRSKTIENHEASSESSHSSPLDGFKNIVFDRRENKSEIETLSDIVLKNQSSGSLSSIATKEPIQKSHTSSFSEVLDANKENDIPSENNLFTNDISSKIDSKHKDGSILSERKENIYENSNLLSPKHSIYDASPSVESQVSEVESSDSLTAEEFENENQDFIKVIVTEKSEHFYENGCEEKGVNLRINAVNDIQETEETKRNDQVERVTESILNQLLTETLPTVSRIKDIYNEDYEDNQNAIVEDLTNKVLHDYVEDATDSMIHIYQEKRKLKIDVDVRHRVQEIMNESLNSPRSALRAQDFMVTTYDVLPPDSPTSSDSERYLLDAEFFSSVSPTKSDKVDANAGIGVVNGTGSGTDNEGFWFDEDIGLGRTRREAEELRRQQLQIEQEIQQLEQAQEQIPSYFYVREIPNKPPPPYTPPGQASHSRRSVSQAESIPTQQKKIETLVTQAVQFLCEVKSKNKELALVQPPQYFLTEDKSTRVYRKFLFDLARQLFCEVISRERKEDVLPWNKTVCRRKQTISAENKEALCQFINKQVSVLFEFEPRAVKDNLIIRWSRKKRDRIDELLVRETQEEERDWTDYSEDEVTVKNQVALSIWDQLLSDTVSVLSNVLQKKLKYCQQS